jgi:hypothetical protein
MLSSALQIALLALSVISRSSNDALRKHHSFNLGGAPRRLQKARQRSRLKLVILLDRRSQFREAKRENKGDQETESTEGDDHKELRIANRGDEAIPRFFQRSDTSGFRRRLKFPAYCYVGHYLTPSFPVGAEHRHHCLKDECDWNIVVAS